MNTTVKCNSSSIEAPKVIEALCNVFDPEIDYSIYDIGLVYEITIENDKIFVLMTLTSMSCPEAQSIPDMVSNTLQQLYPQAKIEVEVTFEPAWTVDNMSDEIKLKMGLL